MGEMSEKKRDPKNGCGFDVRWLNKQIQQMESGETLQAQRQALAKVFSEELVDTTMGQAEPTRKIVVSLLRAFLGELSVEPFAATPAIAALNTFLQTMIMASKDIEDLAAVVEGTTQACEHAKVRMVQILLMGGKREP